MCTCKKFEKHVLPIRHYGEFNSYSILCGYYSSVASSYSFAKCVLVGAHASIKLP